MSGALLLGWLAGALAGEPSDHTLIYYNARMALREGEPLEAVKLWLLRNALEDATARVSAYDRDFGSVTWAALGDLGVCQDGHPVDDDGAGLWPIALHNWVVQNMGRRHPKPAKPFDAFQVGRQQRRITVNDVLGSEELRTVQLYQGRCLRPGLFLLGLGEPPLSDLDDPPVAANLMLHLLDRAGTTLADDRVRGRAAVEARRFDLHLQVLALAAREAQILARKQARRGRELGLSRQSVAAMSDDAPAYPFADDSPPAAILRAAVEWPASEWMALSPERRLFLFDRVAAYNGAPRTLDAVVLGVLDALSAAGNGEEVDAWIARYTGSPQDVWDGARGLQLLALDAESGFGERGAIALHRGVSQLERGELRDALRSLAFALQQAPGSRADEEVAALSRRWLSYTASQFESTSELLVTLQALVPARDYAIILEDLMWRAALRADRASFDRGMRAGASRAGGRGALDRRLGWLQPLASGDLAGFAESIRAGVADSPAETLRFLDGLVERLELEEADVRSAHFATLTRIRALVAPLTVEAPDGSTNRQARTADELLLRAGSILQAQQGLGADASARDRALALAPTGEVFAGSVRLAPADPLPWPFIASEVPPPSVFERIRLVPQEWRDERGEWVFGWSLGG